MSGIKNLGTIILLILLVVGCQKDEEIVSELPISILKETSNSTSSSRSSTDCPPDKEEDFICRGEDVCEGWLVTALSKQLNCSSSSLLHDTWRINKVKGTSMLVCSGQDLPEGWAVTSIGYGLDCNGDFNNSKDTWRIEKLEGTQMNICGLATPPKGWKLVRTYHNSNCESGQPTLSDNAMVIERIAGTTTGGSNTGGGTTGGGTSGGTSGGGGGTTGGGGCLSPIEKPNNGIDDNCNGLVDEVDNDGDGVFVYTSCSSEVCPPQDCNDNSVYVGIQQPKEEPNNGIDDDCNGLVDEQDKDGDSYMVYVKCLEGDCPQQDCNDNNANINPGATERMNNRDNNCNGLVDEIDNDGDGFLTYKECDLEVCPPKDCDDNNPTIHPEAKDIINNGIDENCSGQDRQVIYQVVYGGRGDIKKLNKRSPLSKNMDHLLVGDFNGDGISDLLRANGTNWVLYKDGREELEVLDHNISIPANQLKVGDFNGDGEADLFHATGKKWRVAYSGKRPWVKIRESEVPITKLHIGDFDGDGISDVAAIFKKKLWISSGGTGRPIVSEGLTFKEFGFLIGDFDADGKDDIFNGNGDQWRILSAGTGTWEVIRNHTRTTDELQVGYFNEGAPDVQADIMFATGEDWRVWYGGKGARQILKTNTETNLKMGDFNGDGVTDIFRIRTKGE